MNRIIEEDILKVIDSKIVDWERFKNKTVLVAGANGMLPSYMVYTLLFLNKYRDYHVHVLALVRNRARGEKVFSDFDKEDGLEFLVQDVSESVSYEGKIDYIIHAASQAAPSYYGVDPVGTLKANVVGTLNLLELAKKNQVEGFLFYSSGSIYGEFKDESKKITEDMYGYIDPLSVRICYAESKRMGENMCVSYAYQYKVPTKIVRIFHTLGPNVNLNDGRVFSDFAKNISRGENIILKSDGSTRRTFCYVVDAVIAYFKILLDGEVAQAYNVGGDERNDISMKELAEVLCEAYSDRNIKIVYDINKDDLTYAKMKTPQKQEIPSIDKICALGWELTYDVEASFRRVIDANTPAEKLLGGGIIRLNSVAYNYSWAA